MAGSGDLIGGRYPLGFSLNKAFGGAVNATQSNINVRSNAEWFGLASVADTAAALVSGSMTVVAVPVEPGDVISTVSVVVGGTGASTPTHAWAACYSGVLTTALPIGTQSTDSASAAIAASGVLKFTLGTAAYITTTNAPYGYIYVGIGATASTVPSLGTFAVASAVAYPYFTNSPYAFVATISASGGTAPTSITLSSTSRTGTAPIVLLQ